MEIYFQLLTKAQEVGNLFLSFLTLNGIGTGSQPHSPFFRRRKRWRLFSKNPGRPIARRGLCCIISAELWFYAIDTSHVRVGRESGFETGFRRDVVEV